MSNGIYTFYPEFSQYVTLYRGVTAVWIGNGDSSSPANPDFPAFNDQGVLYASYIDDSVQNLGPVSSFAEAVQSGKAGPGTDFPTEADWIQHIAITSQHAQDALTGAQQAIQGAGDSESWAVGTRDGEPDTERENAATNNSKYWSEKAASEANDAEAFAVSANGSAEEAEQYADEAKEWANWNAIGNPSATNNSKAYSEVSAEQRRQSESWAVGTRDGQDDTQRSGAATNNSKYWAQQAQGWAKDKQNDNAKYYSEVAGSYAQSANDAESAAKKWANWNSEGEPSASNNSKAYSESAAQKAQTAEAWANGTRNGFPISQDDEAANKFARYWAIQANTSSTASQNSASQAASSAALAGQWANGSGTGTPGVENNAEYYAELAGDRANSIRNPIMVVEYQSSPRASVIPTGDWVSTRDPVKGEYLWMRMTLRWGDGTTSVFYSVTYQGMDGSGAVLSVNGATGAVIIDGSNIYVDYDAEQRQTIAESLDNKVDATDFITDSQIDALFEG